MNGETNNTALVSPEERFSLLVGLPANTNQYIEDQRRKGYPALSPLGRQFALEFVLTGATLRRIAKLMEQPLTTISTLYHDPLVRAFIADLQTEVGAHRIINEKWVETQIINLLPKLLGEEPIDIVTSKGSHVRKKKFHGAELASLYKHFSGGEDQKKAGGVQVVINFGDLGVTQETLAMQGRVVESQ